MRNFLAEISPYDPTAEETVTLRISSAGADSSGVVLDGKQWLPVITQGLKRTIEFFDQGLPSDLVLSNDTLRVLLSEELGNYDWSNLSFNGATAKVWIGELGEPFANYRLIFTGKCGAIQRDGALAAISLLGSEGSLTGNVLSEYAGTGGAEGDANLKGNLKPRAFGVCANVEPVLIDQAYQIYQFHDGTASGVSMIYENGLPIDDAATSTHTTYTALRNATLQPGEFAIAPAVGMLRLGGQPRGKVTADVAGEGGSTIASIVTALITEAGGTVNSSSINAWTQSWCAYVDSQTSYDELTRSAFRGWGFLFADSSGAFRASKVWSAATPITLKHDIFRHPVRSVKQLKAGPPAYQVKIGHSRCWAVHSANEISEALVLAGLGAEAAQTAAENAQSAADAANTRLASMADDGVLDRTDKYNTISEYQRIIAEQGDIDAKADLFGVSRTAYDAAITALTNYLTGLSPAWNNTSTDTPINGTTFRAKFDDIYAARQTILNTNYVRASERSTWAGVTGAGKPVDNATRNTGALNADGLNSIALTDSRITDKSLANLDSTANTKLGGIESGATSGDNSIQNATFKTNADGWVFSGTGARIVESGVAYAAIAVGSLTGETLSPTNRIPAVSGRNFITLRAKKSTANNHTNFNFISLTARCRRADNSTAATLSNVRAVGFEATNNHLTTSPDLYLFPLDFPVGTTEIELTIAGANTGGTVGGIHITDIRMARSQIGADQTSENDKVKNTEYGATSGDNDIRNPNVALDNSFWRLTANGQPNVSPPTVVLGGQKFIDASWGDKSLNPNCSEAYPYSVQWSAVVGPTLRVNALARRSSGSDRTDSRLRLNVRYEMSDGSTGSANNLNPDGVLTGNFVTDTPKLFEWTIPVPAGAKRYSLYFGPYALGGTQGTILVTNTRASTSQLGATDGAISGASGNLKDSTGTKLKDVDVRNIDLRISGAAGQLYLYRSDASNVDMLDLSDAGIAALAYKTAVDLSTSEVANKSLANLDATANTKLTGIETGATVGGKLGTNIKKANNAVASEAEILTALGTAADVSSVAGVAAATVKNNAALAALGLEANGDIKRPIPTTIKDSSNILSRTGGGTYSGVLDADRFTGSASDTKLTGIEEAADVSAYPSGPAAATFKHSSTGVAETGEFPRDFVYQLNTLAGAETAGVSWSYVILSGSINGYSASATSRAMSGTAEGTLTVSSMTSDSAEIQITGTKVSKTVKTKINLTKIFAAPNNSGGGGAGQPVLASQSSGFTYVNESSFTAISNTLTVTAGTTSLVVDGYLELSCATNGSGTYEVKVQRKVSGTWTDFGAVLTAIASRSFDPSSKETFIDNGNVTFNRTATVTAGSTVEVRLVARIAAGSTSANVSGSFQMSA